MSKENKRTKLKPHQKRVLDKLRKNDAVLAYHGLGSGKTLTALKAGEEYGGLSVIGPASLRGNFEGEKKKHKVKGDLSYSSYAKPEVSEKSKVLAFDEAHRMGRMESKRSKYPDKYKKEKTLLLTGTPIRNRPDELIPLMRGLGINIPRDRRKFNETFIGEEKVEPGLWAKYVKGVEPGERKKAKNLHILRRALKGKVDTHKTKGSKSFPELKEKIVEVPMSASQVKTYNTAMKRNPSLAYKIRKGIPPSKAESRNMNAFLNATRQISNTPKSYNIKDKTSSPKMDKIVAEIKKHHDSDKNYKGFTYSNYLDSGVSRISKRLKEKGIPYAAFTGKTSDKDRKEIIKKYNKGDIKHLLLSGAGSEGLDLKGTKLIQITEPH
jgi:SNF2 family DNA or RNA helicase